MKWICMIFGIVIVFLFASPVRAWEEGRVVPTTTPGLHLYQKDRFRILYRLQGRDAVPSRDVDKNGVPDYVEDVAKQLWAAEYVFLRVCGFSDPLASPRYQNVRFINVWIVHPEKIKGFLGVSFDKPDGSKNAPQSLTIFLSRILNIANDATPTHEYFHLVQNGMSQFKNAWYFEGLARWSENALFKRKLFAEERWSLSGILSTPVTKEFLLASSYDTAKFFWNPLSLRCPADRFLFLPQEDPLLSLKYSNGAKVLQDREFPGVPVVRRFLELLGKQEQTAFTRLRYKQWTRENQKNYANNPYILKALEQSVATPGICRKKEKKAQ